MTFWIAWCIDVVVALIFVAFFLIGLADGSVSSFNIALWALVLGVVGAVVAGGFALHASERTRLANTVVALLAVPSTLVGLFFLVLLLVPARWN